MKTKLLPLAVALAITLTGCSSILQRDYSSVQAHVEYPVTGDDSVLRAENYQGLVNAMVHFVTLHEEEGTVRLNNYNGDVEADLEQACREVCQEDPLGAYAVEEMTYTYTQVVSYFEVTLSIRYCRTAAQVDAIRTVTGAAAIREIVGGAIADFDRVCTMRLNYFDGDVDALKRQVVRTYFDTPASAFGLPEVDIALYPETGGEQRVVEITFQWPQETRALKDLQTQVAQKAAELLQEMDAQETDAQALAAVLDSQAQWSAEGSSGVDGALLQGRADSQGMALALRLLCQLSRVEATVVQGELSGDSWYWLVVETDSGWRHLDPSREGKYCTDEQMEALGYQWNGEDYPSCV